MDETDPYFLNNVSLYSNSYALVGAMYDHLSERNIDHTLLLRRKNDMWEALKYTSASIGTWRVDFPKPAMITVAVEGIAFRFDDDGQAEEIIDDSDEGPSELVLLRCGAMVEDQLVVAGMARHVYVRDKSGTWVAIDAGIFVPRAERTAPVGFFALAARRMDDLYAAGYGGEIWHYDGGNWVQETSPTNLSITAADMSDDGTVHLVGQLGTYIVGRKGEWRVVENTAHKDDFWGVQVFQGTVYFSTRLGLYRLKDEVIEPVESDVFSGGTFFKLASTKDMIWSVGEKNIFQSNNGYDWEAIDLP